MSAESPKSAGQRFWEFCGHFSTVTWIVGGVLTASLYLISFPPLIVGVAGGISLTITALGVAAKIKSDYDTPFVSLDLPKTFPVPTIARQPDAPSRIPATTNKPATQVQIGRIHCFVMNSETGERLRASVVVGNDLTGKTYKDVTDRTGGLDLSVPYGSYSVRIVLEGYHTRVCAANVDNDYGSNLHVKLEMLEAKRSLLFCAFGPSRY